MSSGKNYVEAWQKAIFFYKAQRQGKLAPNPLNWRGDSGMNDGKDVGMDLTGGYADAGDNWKTNFTIAYTMCMLGWSAIEYKSTYIKHGLWTDILDAIKWGVDFIVKCHPEPNKLVGQISLGVDDHTYWGPPEFMPHKRTTFFIDEKKPGSDLAASASAALSIASMLWKDSNPVYSASLLRHSRELFNFADKFRGKYSDVVGDANQFYASGGFVDELICGSLWLYKATGEDRYKAFALDNSRDLVKKTLRWCQCWDDKSYEALYLLYKFCGDTEAGNAIERFLDFWCDQIPTSPGGLKFLNMWGSLRYSSTAAFMAAVYIDKYNTTLTAAKKQKYNTLLESQINYILGDNPNKISYIVGYGPKYPQNPHHRAAHGSWKNSIEDPKETRHILYGALVGGPNLQDQYSDKRNNYVDNEVAIDYNAGLVGALAAMSSRYGGSKVTIPAEVPGIEYFVNGVLTNKSTGSLQMNLFLHNNSGWPPASPQLTFRYYLSQKNVIVSAVYKQHSNASVSSVKMDGQHPYFEVSLPKGTIYPGGPTTYVSQLQINIVSQSGSYDASKDWSAKGLSAQESKMVNIPVYANNMLKYGALPSGATPIPVPNPIPVPVPDPTPPASDDIYKKRFQEMYKLISQKYYSKDGAPYHSLEKFIIEAPDHGATSTSEAYSYFALLEAANALLTRDVSGLSKAWQKIETQIIPSTQQQPGNSNYNPQKPAVFAPEWETPDKYPAELNSSVPVGNDPICSELQKTYGTANIYGMHWLLDLNNVYGYGNMGDGVSTPSYVNTFQRGEQESVWETVPHPSWEEFKWGVPSSGFLKLFTKDQNYAKQWRYTNAPDADARLVEVMYKFKYFSGITSSALEDKTKKMGDYLRYSMFDKYFKKLGCQDPNASGGGYDSCHYLISWYYSWGGGIGANWAWRIGCSHAHFGYQNPLAAYAMCKDLSPRSPNAKRDWQTSLQRQIEFYYWLQSKEGAISGGATNSYKGRYEKYPSGIPTFYGMMWDPHPVFRDPPSNHWIGWQVWSMQRVAEYYYFSKDTSVKLLLDKWVDWMLEHTTITTNDFKYPVEIDWSGMPYNHDPSIRDPAKKENSDLHVVVTKLDRDVGTCGAYIKTLLYYAFAIPDQSKALRVKTICKQMLDLAWNLFKDKDGFSVETLQDFTRLDDSLSIPSNISGEMPSGAPLNSSSTFRSIRPMYKNFEAKKDVKMRYHRYWEQVELSTAFLEYYILSKKDSDPTPTPDPTPDPTPTPDPGSEGLVIEKVRENGWPTGATLEYKILNKTNKEVNGWQVKINISGGSIANIWNAQKVSDTIYKDAIYNAVIPVGGSISFGMNISHSGEYSVSIGF